MPALRPVSLMIAHTKAKLSEVYLDRAYRVQHADNSGTIKTPYDYIEYDSYIEQQTAQALDDTDKRRLEENLKILCGEAHFKALDGVDYAVATSVAEVVAVD